jgi:hypothetical protein
MNEINEKTQFEKPLKDEDLANYAKFAEFCNENKYVIKDDNPKYYYADKLPEPTLEEKNAQIKAQRQAAYAAEADALRLDWDEQRALYEEYLENDNYTDEERETQKLAVEQCRNEWLAKKQEIREKYPYLDEAGNPIINDEEE